MFNRIKSLFGGKKESKESSPGKVASFFKRLLGRTLDDEVKKQIEQFLYRADVGGQRTRQMIERLENEHQGEDAVQALNSLIVEMMKPYESPEISFQANPEVVLLIGINGAGKTTTIAKLAHQFKSANQSVVLAAGDTFRAAAIEQLQAWADRVDVPLVRQNQGSDSASVIFDAYESAKAKGMDVLLADTAGRLHNKGHLVAELEKCVRVLGKLDPSAPHHVWLVLDGTIGQSSLEQAKIFCEKLPVTGLVITKLDSSARGGSLIAISDEVKKPIIAVGVGERVEDLIPFNAEDYAKRLLEAPIDEN